jgi:hypothetical protein
VKSFIALILVCSATLATGASRDPVIEEYWRGFFAVQKKSQSDEDLFAYDKRFAAAHSPEIIRRMIIDLRTHNDHEESVGYIGVIRSFNYKISGEILRSIIDSGTREDRYNARYLLFELDQVEPNKPREPKRYRWPPED